MGVGVFVSDARGVVKGGVEKVGSKRWGTNSQSACMNPEDLLTPQRVGIGHSGKPQSKLIGTTQVMPYGSVSKTAVCHLTSNN